MLAYSVFTEFASQFYPMSLFLFFPISAFLINISNTHTPTLEGANPIKSGPQQMSPQCGAMIDDVLNMGQQQMPTKMGLTTYDTLYGV